MQLKILFKGSLFKSKKKHKENKLIKAYSKELAKSIVQQEHKLLFTSARELDMYIAYQIYDLLGRDLDKARQKIEFILTKNENFRPPMGVVRRVEVPEIWSIGRTYAVSLCDALITIGGKAGTADCIEKAMLSRKPVFTVYKIDGLPQKVWNEHYIEKEYHYIEKGDAGFVDDINFPRDDFFPEAFRILNQFQKGFPWYFFDRDKQRDYIAKWRRMIIDGKFKEALAETIEISQRVDQGIYNELHVLSGLQEKLPKPQLGQYSIFMDDLMEVYRRYLKVVDLLEQTI